MKLRFSNLVALFRYLTPGSSLVLLAGYAVMLTISLLFAYELRFDFLVPENWRAAQPFHLAWVVPLQLVLLFLFGQFGGLLGYFRLPDMYRVFGALAISAFLMVNFWFIAEGRGCPPRSVILGNFVIALLLVCGFRVGLRVVKERSLRSGSAERGSLRRVAIVGAGDVGAAVASDFLSRRALGIEPVVFLDDDRRKWKKHVHGITVVDSPDNLLAVNEQFGLDEVIIAMPSAPTRRVREVVELAREIGLPAEIVPSLAELTTGRVRASRVRPVDIQDLLGREPVKLDSANIRSMLEGRVVLVTGAGGSIGSELSRQIAFNGPSHLLLVDQSEVQLFQIEQQLIREGYGEDFTPLVGDILDETRMRAIFEKRRPEIVFHAAAHKHVYLMERQPGEAFKNNSIGTKRLADLAKEMGVDRFVLVSTDKAINPTNVMGACKRLAEVYIQSLNRASNGGTRFMAVRFGNVLDSSGSVVPIFRRQIADGGPVTVTHPEVTRYFMTIPEAVGLVLQSATLGEGGEIFVLDMGVPVKILDLARQMIELSGFRPETDIEIEFVGLRPGEKLFEELQHGGESLEETTHSRVLRFVGDAAGRDAVQEAFRDLAENADHLAANEFKGLLKKHIPEYEPYVE